MDTPFEGLEDPRMKLYGHELGTDRDAPIRLKEAAIAADASTLRLLAEFLIATADRMDSDGDSFGHEHFEDYSEQAPREPSFVVVAPIPETVRNRMS